MGQLTNECEICHDLVTDAICCTKCGTILCSTCLKDHQCEKEIKIPPDAFKVFLRPKKPVSHLVVRNVLAHLRRMEDRKLVLIPKFVEVIIVRGDGTVETH